MFMQRKMFTRDLPCYGASILEDAIVGNVKGITSEVRPKLRGVNRYVYD